MCECRHANAGGELRYGECFLAPITRRVAGEDADSERALMQPPLYAGDDARGLVGRRESELPSLPALRFLKEGQLPGRLHPVLFRDAREKPRRREPVVYRPSLAGDALIRRCDRECPGLELERGGDAVKRSHARRRRILAVRVEINEPRRDHKPFRVEHCPPAERRARDGCNPAVADTD